MRPLPDNVAPLPRATVASLGDAGVLAREDAGVLAAATGRRSREERCDLRVRRNAPDHVVVGRGLVSALRELRAGGVVEDLDASGVARGLRIEALEEGSCLAALGFQERDVLLEINGYSLGPYATRREAFESVDDGDAVFAVIHFLRDGHSLEWNFDEIR
jgi:hypothetical protein